MAMRAQMRKQLCSPTPETLLSQLSGYSRPEAHAIDGGHSESTRTLGEQCRKKKCLSETLWI